MKPFGIYVARSGECVGDLESLPTAHRIAHIFLTAWPDLAPLVLVDRVRRDAWAVKPGKCQWPFLK